MKKFIIVSSFFFIIGVLATILVFWLVSKYNLSHSSAIVGEGGGATSSPSPATEPYVPPAIKEALDAGGTTLSDLPLTETQEKVLSTLNIDTEAFVITEEKVACAVLQIGEERTLAIVAGDAPSAIEIAKLTPCLGE